MRATYTDFSYCLRRVLFMCSVVDGPKTERGLRRTGAHTEDQGRVTVHLCGARVEPERRVGVQQRRVRRSSLRVESVPRADGDIV